MTTKHKLIILAVTHLIAMLMGMRLMVLLDPQRDNGIGSGESPSAEIAVADTFVCTATVNARVLNQRTGPGENYDITGSAQRRDVFGVQGWDSSRQWILVDTAEEQAWMSARYLTLSGSCRDLPVGDLAAEGKPAEEAISDPAEATPILTATAIIPLAVPGAASLSPVFTPEVQFWAEEISVWASSYQLDPNLIATVIQIESCGNASISSPAGAQGLFQVMPFHFAPGEDMLDVQTNARRGLEYLKTGLTLAGGDVGLALAGYNGGHGVISRAWSSWPVETQRYYTWGSGIYAETVSGVSPTLETWLAAGGSALCARASESQRILMNAS